MSQQDLAVAADVVVNTVWAAENGKLRPRARTLRRLAKALGVRFEELVRPEGELPPAAGDLLEEYIRGRAAGRLSKAEVEHLRHLLARLVDAELETRGRGSMLKKSALRYGGDRAAENGTDYD